jgi:hypothetical protein
MTISPWALPSWPQHEWYMPTQKRSWPKFVHAATVCHPEVRTKGTTIWVSEIDGNKVGLAWDWDEVLPGVIALVDANAIISNLRFLRDHDHYEAPLRTVVSLARLVHALPWQRTVVRTLRREGVYPSQARVGKPRAAPKRLSSRSGTQLRSVFALA